MFNKLSIKFKLIFAFGLIIIIGLPVPYVIFKNYQKTNASFNHIIEATFPRIQALLETKSIVTSIQEHTTNINLIDFSHAQEDGTQGAIYKYNLLSKMAELNKWQQLYERHLTSNNQFLIVTFRTFNDLKDKIILLVLEIIELKEKQASQKEIDKKQEQLALYSTKLANFITYSIANETKSLDYQQTVAKNTSEQATKVTILGSLIVLLGAIILTFLLSRRLSMPIIDLRNAAISIRKGKLDTPIAITTDDEIGDLAEALQKMIGSLLAANNELKNQQEKLKEMSAKLVIAARQAGMADVAISVLHNIGNALNSVNVSAQLVNEKIGGSKLSLLTKTADLIQDNVQNLAELILHEERGKHLLAVLMKLSAYWPEEQKFLLSELSSLNKGIQHIKDIITLQQSLSSSAGIVQPVDLQELVEDALMLNINALQRINVTIKREYFRTDEALIDKVKVQQILVNLIRNAKDALADSPNNYKILTLKIHKPANDKIKIEVTDNGIGIEPDNIVKIFNHGFTTKKNGHGFGLHASAVAAQELDGSLIAQSDGIGLGATFILELPYKIAKS